MSPALAASLLANGILTAITLALLWLLFSSAAASEDLAERLQAMRKSRDYYRSLVPGWKSDRDHR